MRIPVLCAAFVTTTLSLTAQAPQLQNGQLTSATSANLLADLDNLKAHDGTAWLTYTVPTSRPVQSAWGTDQVAYLAGDHNWSERNDEHSNDHAEYRARVLLRVADHVVQTVRIENPERKLDAGGARVVYVASVDPTQSIAVLQSLAEHANTNRLRDATLLALSVHQSSATVPALVALAAPDRDFALREKAAFWLSTQRGKEALPVLDRWAREDRDERFREKLTFYLTLTHQAGAADVLIRMAHQDESARVRKQAQFWMANLGGKRITDNLSESASNDPDLEVRKSAVFGLSRLPDHEGTPKLIQLASTSKDRAIRKQAVFWLGQSDDPKALAYLTGLLR